MILTKTNGEVVVFPYGSEAQQSWEKGINILAELYKIDARDKAEKRLQKEEKTKAQIKECDSKIFQRQFKQSDKSYNITQVAAILGVTRQTIYYWIKKGWVKPKRDYRNYPVFTVLDIEDLIKWKNTVK